MKKILTLVACACSFMLTAQKMETPDAMMLRFPDVSSSQITFVYAEDIWIAPISGGVAKRLTSSKGMEYHPKFSPSEKTIAFSGNYDGNYDVYTISNQGDQLKRITYHPQNDRTVGWTNNGTSILYASGQKSPSNRFNQLYTISNNGGNPQQLPLFYAEIASYNEDGTKLAYQYLNRTGRTWKRYQGGTASDLYIYDFKEKKSTQITEYKGTDAIPMWKGDKVYFISDRGENHIMNLWSYDSKSKTFKQETNFDTYDVKFPSIGPNHIVFENGGVLYLYSFENGQSSPVQISVPSEHLAARPEWKKLDNEIRTWWISPTGKRALFDARGEIITVPANEGITTNLTHTSNAAEQAPHWSPDGKYIAYFSDATGEYQLMRKNADGTGEATALTTKLKGYHTGTLWSPDSKKIAFTHYDGTLFYIDITSKKITKVDRSNVNPISDYKWSPDSKWLVYAKATNSTRNAITVFELATKKITPVTSDFYNSTDPVFSQDGQYIFFASNRIFSPVYSDFDGTWAYNNSTVLMALPLTKTTPSPIAPKNDVEEVEESTPQKEKSSAEGQEESIKIDFDQIIYRATALPLPAGNYRNLQANDDKLLFISSSHHKASMMFWDIKDQKSGVIMDGIWNFELSADGKKFMYNSNGSYGITGVHEGAQPGDGRLNTSNMEALIDPIQEWNQIFYEAWRLERDFFYAKNMHGVNWDMVKERYAKLMPFCNSREDLNYIIGEMIGELNVGHAYVGGGDQEYAPYMTVGLLGADLESDGKNAIKINKIYEGALWDVDVKSPLKQPGIDVKEDQYIVAVNHVKVDGKKSPYAAFQNLGKKVVTLTISDTPDGKNSFTIELKLLTSESRLRNLAWIEQNRKYVYEATNGMCGYIYVPNTGVDGQNQLMRMYQGQDHMHALIIDERFNSGGQIPDRFVELLNRPIRSYFSRRDLVPFPIPFNGLTGPRVMLANQWAGSGGDMFPYIFKQEKVGPVVGKRTWGGLVGISGIPPLVDGGFLTSPNFGFFNLDGEYDVEGVGVSPDYEVDNMPEDVYNGIDQQLLKAIELINASLKENPPVQVGPPADPVKTGIGNN